MIKDIISYMLSFLLAILIILTTMITFVQNKILNANYIENKLEQSEYYEKLTTTINEGFENYIMQSGMDSTIFEEIYDNERLKQDTNMLIEAMINNGEIQLDTSDIKEKLDANIREYIKKNNLAVNPTVENQIQTFETTIINTYENSVAYSTTIVKTIGKTINMVNKILPTVFYIVIGATIFNVLLLIIVNIKNKRKILNYFAVIVFTISGLSILGIILEKHFLDIQSLTVLNDNLSVIIQLFINEAYNILYVSSVAGIVGGIFFSVLGCKKKEENCK